MSSLADTPIIEPQAGPAEAAATAGLPLGHQAWARFRQNRLGFYSLWVFLALFLISLCAELVSNEKPLIASYHGHLFFPAISNPPETAFGGQFRTETDWFEPLIQRELKEPGNWALFAPNRFSGGALDYFATAPDPAPPSGLNYLGTDENGRDVLAGLLYGFRISVLFGMALTLTGIAIGLTLGAIQGYFGGWVDLSLQRFIEVWGSLPELYLLIIFAAIFNPSLLLLLVLLSLFGWIGLADYVRAEFLRNRTLEYVKAARALGLSSRQIMWRHILPNSLTPVITFLPFRMSAAIIALTSLDFLGLGVPSGTASLGDLMRQGKDNLYAWWITIPTFIVLLTTLLLLTFIGDALRDAMDVRKERR